jgi:hypothetical protein
MENNFISVLYFHFRFEIRLNGPQICDQDDRFTEKHMFEHFRFEIRHILNLESLKRCDDANLRCYDVSLTNIICRPLSANIYLLVFCPFDNVSRNVTFYIALSANLFLSV